MLHCTKCGAKLLNMRSQPHTFLCPRCNNSSQSGYLLQQDHVEDTIFERFEEWSGRFPPIKIKVSKGYGYTDVREFS